MLAEAFEQQGGILFNEQLAGGLRRAARSGRIVPVMVGTLGSGGGGTQLMADILSYLLGHSGPNLAQAPCD
jgi:hypothetical protein